MAWWSGDKGVDALLTFAIGSSALSLALSKFQSRAPYGRFGKPDKHFSLDPRLGWLLMELPASVCFAYGVRRGLAALRARAAKEAREAKEAGRPAPARPSGSLVRAVLCALWARHYLNRGFYFPLTIRVAEGGQASFALFNSAIGAIFVGIHGYLNGRAFSDLGGYTDAWLTDPRFLLGAVIYEAGFWTILHSEHTLKNLRPAGQVVSAAERYKM
jgi:3-oxo-5-alpha-steroid 4-dehydrogenase 1